MQLLLSLLLASACQAPACYTIKPTACEANTCDITGPLEAALASCKASPPVSDKTNGARGGCRFELPAGDLLLTRTIRICRQHDIVGQGGRFWGARTRIQTQGSYTAFHFDYADACRLGEEGGGGGGGSLSDLAIIGTLGASRTKPSFGVLVEAGRVRLERLYIARFVQGIRISADVHRSPRTNANVFRVLDVRIDSNEHAGIFIEGGDANAGLLTLPDVAGNCAYASRWPSLGDCHNIVERSFLGSTVIAGHTSTCIDFETAKVCRGYEFSGSSNRGVCLGCYSESNQTLGHLAPNTVAVSGLGGWEGPGLWILGTQLSSLRVRNDRDPENVVIFEAGRLAPAGTAWQVRALSITKGAWPLSLYVGNPNKPAEAGWYYFLMANSVSWSSLRLRGDSSVEGFGLGDLELAPRWGQVWLGHGWVRNTKE